MMNTVMMLKAPVPAVRTPSHTIRRQVPRLARPVVMAVHSPDKRSSSESKSDNALAGVGGYLMDGVASIFSPMQNSRVPWIEPTGYTGSVTHHDVARLRKLHATIVETREQVMGCTDPAAVNFSAEANTDDGTCQYIDLLERTPVGQDDERNPTDGGLYGFVVGAVSRVFGNNFKTGQEPETWDNADHTGYAGRVSRRGRRDVQRMLKFEALVKQTLDEAEKKVDRY